AEDPLVGLSGASVVLSRRTTARRSTTRVRDTWSKSFNTRSSRTAARSRLDISPFLGNGSRDSLTCSARTDADVTFELMHGTYYSSSSVPLILDHGRRDWSQTL
ncbi:hypothetical protein FPOA_12811, partial [Fusarium poae]